MRKVFPRREAFSSSVYKSTYSGHFILSENFGFLTTFLKKKQNRLEYRTVITETEKQPSKNHEQTKVSVILSSKSGVTTPNKIKLIIITISFSVKVAT